MAVPSVATPRSLDGTRRHILAINNDPAIIALFRDLLVGSADARSAFAVDRRAGAGATAAPAPWR